MGKVLLSIHVVAAILAIGPVAVAASLFPRAARQLAESPADATAAASARLLHRICRVYSALGLVVPAFGFATAATLGVLGDAWVLSAVVLTGLAAVVLVGRILPGQRAVLLGPAEASGYTAVRTATQLGMYTGIFNLLWVCVTVLMIVRPGSTTGV